MQEGCLSLPGVMLMVKRPTEVTLQYQDVKGEIVVETFLSLGARVVLHEYDHMLGQNFTQ
jgi:peptide deformylase